GAQHSGRGSAPPKRHLRVVRQPAQCKRSIYFHVFWTMPKRKPVMPMKILSRYSGSLTICGTHRLLSLEDRAAGVAYNELWIRGTLTQNGLRLCEVTYGTWSGGRDMLQSLHDIILALPK